MNIKNKILLLGVAAVFLGARPVGAQFTLEKSYDYSLTATRLDATQYNYYLMDVSNHQCRIYNTDHTLWKTINIPLPANYYLYDIKFVTRDLFNADEAIELWYSAYEYTTAETGRYTSAVINEHGTVLADLPGGLYAYVVRAGEEAYKLIVYSYDYSVTPGKIQTLVYALPSSVTAVAHVTALLPDPWPNPASGEIFLPLMPRESGALLQVFTSGGQLMLEQKTSGESLYRLSTAGWSPGIYTYRLLAGENPLVSKRFVVH
jgi:hypothetical protein